MRNLSYLGFRVLCILMADRSGISQKELPKGILRQFSLLFLGLPAQQFLHLPQEGADCIQIGMVVVSLGFPLHPQEAIVV